MTGKKHFNRLFKHLDKAVRGELLDALRDYARLFREKAQLEIHRAEAVDDMARKVRAGGPCEQPDATVSREFEQAYRLLDVRFNEVRQRCSRLMQEYGAQQSQKSRPVKNKRAA
jgi:hypothetical protein